MNETNLFDCNKWRRVDSALFGLFWYSCHRNSFDDIPHIFKFKESINSVIVTMDLELTRIDYTLIGITNSNCLDLIAGSLPRETHKVRYKNSNIVSISKILSIYF